MLKFACQSYYDMIPLNFELEANLCFEEDSEENRLCLTVGTVLARIGGPHHIPALLRSLIGMLHFGIITKEILPPITTSEFSKCFKQTSLAIPKPFLKALFIKRQYLDRFRIQHYVIHKDARVKETSLGAFLFGQEEWDKCTWHLEKFPDTWRINIPSVGMDELQSKLKKLEKTLGEKKYNVFWRNCENYAMQFVEDNSISIQVIAGFVLLIILIAFSIAILIVVSKRRKPKQIISV